MENEVITTKVAKLWMGEDNIVRASYAQNANITLKDVQDVIEIYLKLTNGKPYPLLADVRHIKSLTREAREYSVKQEVNKIYTANAILIGSHVSRVIINFFLKFNKPPVPTKVFTIENEALAWLKNFL